MCGFVGLLKFDDSKVDRQDIINMSSAISHRGPDEAGYVILNDEKVGFGHLRLSIIDLITGSQPLYSDDKSLCVVFNGEIYDHYKLREELQKEGFIFNTTSDTEVILALYQKYGLHFVDKMNGEFAFLLWDNKQKILIAVRDRMGVKPLFFYKNANEIIFSSEAKGLLALKRVPRKISTDYLTGPFFGAFPKSTSPFEDIRSLEPGHMLICNEKGIKENIRYWKPDLTIDEKMTMTEAAQGVSRLFREAVARRMVADVPVCLFLSGGIDSVLVGLEMTSISKENVKAFHVAFDRSIYDESAIARQSAKELGVDLEVINCPLNEIAMNISDTVYSVELPLSNPGSVGKFLLSKAVQKNGYKVALEGEGSDELFSGYPYFKMETIWRLMANAKNKEERKHAQQLWEKFKKSEKKTEGTLWSGNLNWQTAEPFFGHTLFFAVRAIEANKIIPQLFNTEKINITNANPFLLLKDIYKDEPIAELDPLKASLLLSLNQLACYIIPMQGDRVEMAHAIEGRTPFLDKELVAFSHKIPSAYLLDIENNREKFILREAFKDIIPKHMNSVSKQPLYAPIWYDLFSTPYGKELYNYYLSSEVIANIGIFRPNFIRNIIILWRLLPRWSSTFRKIDTLIGVVCTIHMLHEQLISKPAKFDENFKMIDRTIK